MAREYFSQLQISPYFHPPCYPIAARRSQQQQATMTDNKNAIIPFPSMGNALLIAICLCLLSPCLSQDSQPSLPETSAQHVQYSREEQQKLMSATDKQRLSQQNGLFDFYKVNPQASLDRQFGFEISNEYEEFHFHLPTDQVVHFLVRIYVLKNNAYIQIPNIEVEPAMHLVVYENNHRIIAEKSVYFQGAVTIEGKQGSTYMLRFFSPSHKLLTVSHSNFLPSSHFQGKVTTESHQRKDLQLSTLNNKLVEIFKNLRFTYLIEMEQRKQLTQRTDSFITFELIEMGLLLVVCLFQIKMVARLFKTDSIL